MSATALAAWRTQISQHPDSAEIEAWVAELLGDRERGPATTEASELRTLVERVTLAPWQLEDAAFAPLRAAGHDDAALFRVCATASSFGVFSRIRVALIALGND